MTHFRAMQYSCQTSGCFNEVHRLDFGQWYDAIPGKSSFSDIDAITEVAGNFLVVEWKSRPGPLPTGQHIMFQRMTKSGQFSVLCAAGPKNLPQFNCVYWRGKASAWTQTTPDAFYNRILSWGQYAVRQPRIA